MNNDCVFCKIINKSIPSYKIYEDDFCYAFLDNSCEYYGHTLVIPKNHCENILDCSNSDLQKVTAAIKKIANHYTQKCCFSGVNIINSNGKSAEQTVFHLHFHIIPRSDNDNFKIWQVRDKKDYNLEQIANKLNYNA